MCCGCACVCTSACVSLCLCECTSVCTRMCLWVWVCVCSACVCACTRVSVQSRGLCAGLREAGVCPCLAWAWGEGSRLLGLAEPDCTDGETEATGPASEGWGWSPETSESRAPGFQDGTVLPPGNLCVCVGGPHRRDLGVPGSSSGPGTEWVLPQKHGSPAVSLPGPLCWAPSYPSLPPTLKPAHSHLHTRGSTGGRSCFTRGQAPGPPWASGQEIIHSFVHPTNV